MPSPPKKKINAAQIVADIRAGMGGSTLRRKYGLSEKGLHVLYRKLLDKGLVHESELERKRSGPAVQPRKALPKPERTRPQPARIDPWACPFCGAEFPQRHDECPKCGAIAAKIASRPYPGPRMQPSRFDRQEETESSSSQWVTVGLSAGMLVLIGVVIVSWAAYRSNNKTGVSQAAYRSGGIKTFTADNFNTDVVDASKNVPILIEFYADW